MHIHDIFGKVITIHTVIYGVYIGFKPTLYLAHDLRRISQRPDKHNTSPTNTPTASLQPSTHKEGKAQGKKLRTGVQRPKHVMQHNNSRLAEQQPVQMIQGGGNAHTHTHTEQTISKIVFLYNTLA